MSKSSNKIIRLKENFKIFQEDMNKPTNEEDLQISTDKLITLIKYKEDILHKKHSVNIVRELMSMYQKVYITLNRLLKSFRQKMTLVLRSTLINYIKCFRIKKLTLFLKVNIKT